MCFQVKVLSLTGQKVSLTMKDVCQDTGKDLNPTSHAHLEVRIKKCICVMGTNILLLPSFHINITLTLYLL